MKIALTGGTGFIGRYIIRQLLDQGHELNCWYRAATGPLPTDWHARADRIHWIAGDLKNGDSARELVEGCDAMVHNAFWKPGTRFQGEEGDLVEFVQTNVVGTIRLIEEARTAGVAKFIFVSTCAVHDRILDDRKLDEAHPLWPRSHYGAHKAAIEKFVHSYGYGHGYDICAVRPTGVYGLHHSPQDSKWYELIRQVVRGETVTCERGGKEVHAEDVAKAIHLLLQSDGTQGNAYSCYDRYVSQFEVAQIAKELSGSRSIIHGEMTRPKNQIDTTRIRSLGMTFGGAPLLRQTIQQIIDRVE